MQTTKGEWTSANDILSSAPNNRITFLILFLCVESIERNESIYSIYFSCTFHLSGCRLCDHPTRLFCMKIYNKKPEKWHTNKWRLHKTCNLIYRLSIFNWIFVKNSSDLRLAHTLVWQNDLRTFSSVLMCVCSLHTDIEIERQRHTSTSFDLVWFWFWFWFRFGSIQCVPFYSEEKRITAVAIERQSTFSVKS